MLRATVAAGTAVTVVMTGRQEQPCGQAADRPVNKWGVLHCNRDTRQVVVSHSPAAPPGSPQAFHQLKSLISKEKSLLSTKKAVLYYYVLSLRK
jgi:hypothetical protein